MKEMNDEALQLLRATLIAVEPWADQFVVIGGWAMQLYRYLADADSGVTVHHTNDIDIAVTIPRRPFEHLPDRLRAQGLVAVRSRATKPATTIYQAERHGSDDRAPEYVEFLVPQIGADKRDAVEIAPGVGALTLRYLDLSFAQVRIVHAVRVPSPTCRSSRFVYRVPQATCSPRSWSTRSASRPKRRTATARTSTGSHE